MFIQRWEPDKQYERFIERCARISKNSQESTGSTKDFLKLRILSLGHTSVLEHIGFRITIYNVLEAQLPALYDELLRINPYFKMQLFPLDGRSNCRTIRIYANARTLLEWARALTSETYTKFRPLWKFLGEAMPSVFPPVNYIESCLGEMDISEAHSQQAPNSPDRVMVTYLISGFSRAMECQLLRHRTLSFTIRSGRAVEQKEFHMVTPKSCSVMAEDWVENQHYNMLLGRPVPKEDARYYLPQGTATCGVVTGTVDAWCRFLRERLDNAAQWEIRSFALAIRRDLEFYYPHLMRNFISGVGAVKVDDTVTVETYPTYTEHAIPMAPTKERTESVKQIQEWISTLDDKQLACFAKGVASMIESCTCRKEEEDADTSGAS
jgi:thymidylate synthase ThyX